MAETTGRADTKHAAPRPARRGAAILVDSLVRAGVRTVFGVPGDTGVTLYDELYGRTADLRHVLARDERHAVAMADAYARLTNQVGVVEVSSGGGTSYAIGGLGEAFASSVPVLVVTSDIHSGSRGTGALTEIDQRALFSAITKAQYVVESALDVPAAVAGALAEATTGRPAPVVVIVPEDVLDEHTEEPPAAAPATITAPLHRPAADSAEMDRAAALLANARQPAVLAGGGVHVSVAYAGLDALATALGAGVATTIHGKGSVADTHPCSLGIAGNNGGTVGVNAFLADADVVLLVGTRANATDTDSFTAPPRSAATIRVDIDAGRAGMNYPDAVRLVGDAATVLGALVTRLPDLDEEERKRRVKAVAAARAIRHSDVVPPLAEGVLLAREVVETVRAVCTDCSVVVDPGTPTPNVASYWTADRAGHDVVVPRGHGPMGYAIPASVGAAFARPGRPVVAFTADGSFAMCCGELETIARFGLPIVMIQMTNYSLGWIKMLQHLYTGQRYFGVDPGPIDAVAVAAACGVPAIRATTLDELRTSVADAVGRCSPLYVDVRVPHMIDVVPPVPAWHRALDGDDTRPVY